MGRDGPRECVVHGVLIVQGVMWLPLEWLCVAVRVRVPVPERADKPYHIKAAGRVWWYKAEAVRLADRAGPVASQWRDQAVTKKYCSRAGDEEGPVCAHGSEIIRTDHWSCCGVGSKGAPCTKVCLVWARLSRGRHF